MPTTVTSSAMPRMPSSTSRRGAPTSLETTFRISSGGRRARCFLRTTPSNGLPNKSRVSCGLLDSDDHGVGADEMLEAGAAEARFLHPPHAIGAGVVEAAGGFDEHV